jgi:hypothetical protein
MEFGIAGLLFFLVSCGGTFLLTRWLTRRRRDADRDRERQAADATQSRQVRRARQRRERGN